MRGLAELRRDLRAINQQLVPELRKAEAQGAAVIAAEAARRAPRGARPLPKGRRKRLHETVRPLIRGTRVYVGATARQAPHANVNHWGGEIKPKGKPIHFRPRKFIVEAMELKRGEFIAALADALEELFRRNGFH